MEPALCQALLFQKCCVFDIVASSVFILKMMSKRMCFASFIFVSRPHCRSGIWITVNLVITFAQITSKMRR